MSFQTHTHRFFFALPIAAVFLLGALITDAATVDTLRSQIEERNAAIEALEREIAQYQRELDVVVGERQTLQSAVATLDISRRKLGADIRLTQQRINAAEYEINRLGGEIGEKEESIDVSRSSLSSALRTIDEAESQTLVEALLAQGSLVDFWDEVESLQRFQTRLQEKLTELKALKEDLEGAQFTETEKKRELISLRSELAGQRAVLDSNRAAKAELLEETQNEEVRYQEILEEKRRQKEAFEQELFDLESRLQIALDPTRIPPAGKGILSWPVPDPSIVTCQSGSGAKNCLTQLFGKTSSSGRLYASGTHNGIDFRAAPGTKVTAALSGIVEAVGNTDIYAGCYSYGKWVLLRHNNGLSTLYAHLSHIGVARNQEIRSGDFIGYSGNTGYSTGPHLHFTVYATQGVRLVRLGDYKSVTNCPNATIPVAPRDAYLDPLEYL